MTAAPNSTPHQIRLLLADDHQVIIDGLKSLLREHHDIRIVGEALSGEHVLAHPALYSVDVAMIDIGMQGINGIEVAKILHAQHPHIKILMLTLHDQRAMILESINAGATGYLLKNAGQQELLTAIRRVAAGKKYFSSEVATTIVEEASTKTETTHEILTEREIEITKLLLQELSCAEIGERLYISARTVETHRRNIMHKLGVKSLLGLMKYAVQKNWVE
jgi:DNA-binding NarL/FixJ family response regulator